MLGGCRKNQILQTVIARLNQGMSGPPDSYSEEEKAVYRRVEKDILALRKSGFKGSYMIPSDYD
jgi:hypothetical protein